MVGRWRMDGARTGEKYFAPTHAVRGYIGADVTIWDVAMFDVWVTGHHWCTDGRKIFRPYNRGVGANRAGATICGAAIVDTQVMVD